MISMHSTETHNFSILHNRLSYYSKIALRSFINGFTIPSKSALIPTAVIVFLFGYARDLFELLFAATAQIDGLLATAQSSRDAAVHHIAAVLAWAAVVLSVLLYAYLCHRSVARSALFDAHKGRSKQSRSIQAWLVVVAPTATIVSLGFAAAYSVAFGVQTLSAPVEAWSLSGLVADHGVHIIIFATAIILLQGLVGVSALASILDLEHRHTPIFAIILRLFIVGAILAVATLPILVFVVEPIVWLVRSLTKPVGDVPLFSLLLVHGLWIWAATSYAAARLLHLYLRRRVYFH